MSDKKEPKKNCYIYTRVSTDLQVEEGYSLDEQDRRLRDEAKRRNFFVVDKFSDEGVSGKNTVDREGYQKMMKAIRAGKDNVSAILVADLSRFSRNMADVVIAIDELSDFNVALIAIKENLDSSTETGKAMIQMFAIWNERERTSIGERTMAGRMEKARQGKWNGAQPPYGYGLKDGVLIINEAEAEHIRLIFDKFINTEMGYNGVAEWMNEHGFSKVPRGNGVYTRFTGTFVRNALDNEAYIGKIAYGKRHNEKIPGARNQYHMVRRSEYPVFEGQHEAIISDDVWEEVRIKRAETGVKRDKIYDLDHAHLLSGILKCPYCDSPMYGVPSRKYGKTKKDGTPYKDKWYYRCSRMNGTRGEKCDYHTYVPQDEVNEQVKKIAWMAISHTDFQKGVQERLGTKSNLGELEAERIRLEASLQKERSRKTKLLGKIAVLDPDDDTYDSIYEDLQGVLKEYTETIAGLEKKYGEVTQAIQNANAQEATAEDVYQMLKELIRNVDDVPERYQRFALHAFIERVEIFEERQKKNKLWVKHIKFRIPMTRVEDGEEVWGFDFPDDEHDESFLPPKDRHVETVVLMSRVKD